MAVGVTVVVAAAMTYAFRPSHVGHPMMLRTLGATYGVLLLGTLWWLHNNGKLRRLIPQRGDITIGALLAVGLYMVATVVHLGLAGGGIPRDPWIMGIYLRLGDPRVVSTFVVGIAVLAIAAAEEVVWRGWVQGALLEAAPPRRAWLVASGLYAAAHLPTVYLLRDPVAGLNPILVLAALGCGLFWGYLAMRVDRLGPSVFAHALFSWGVVEYPIWRM